MGPDNGDTGQRVPPINERGENEMILTDKQHIELLEAAEPLIKWLNDNCHTHCSVCVGHVSVELKESVSKQFTEEFIKRLVERGVNGTAEPVEF